MLVVRKALEQQVCHLTLHRVTRNVQPTALVRAVTDKATTTVSQRLIGQIAIQTNGVLNHNLNSLVAIDRPKRVIDVCGPIIWIGFRH